MITNKKFKQNGYAHWRCDFTICLNKNYIGRNGNY